MVPLVYKGGLGGLVGPGSAFDDRYSAEKVFPDSRKIPQYLFVGITNDSDPFGRKLSRPPRVVRQSFIMNLSIKLDRELQARTIEIHDDPEQRPLSQKSQA